MASEYFSVRHTAGKTVYFRYMRLSDSRVFDFTDNAWELNLAACTNPKLAATEKTDMGDTSYSIYTASYDVNNMNSTTVPVEILCQAVDDLATDELISEDTFWVQEGRVLGQDWMCRRVQSLAPGNILMDLNVAATQQATQKVAVGKLDNVIYKGKTDADANWAAPVWNETVHMHYATLGDSDPAEVKEDG